MNVLGSMSEWLGHTGDQALENYRLAFGVSVGVGAGLLLAVSAGLLGAAASAFQLRRRRLGPRISISVLRGLSVLIVVLLLLDPRIEAQRITPGDEYVALMFDDSKSMRVKTDGGDSRGERLKFEYRRQNEFEKKLAERFRVVRYRFGSRTERLANLDELNFDQAETRIADSVGRVLDDLSGLDVAAVVLFSDGSAQPGEAAPTRSGEDTVPIFSVGVVGDRLWADVAVESVSVSRSNFDRNPANVVASVSAVGFADAKIALEVQVRIVGTDQEFRTVGSAEWIPDSENERRNFRFEFVPEDKGWLEGRLRVEVLDSGPSSARAGGGLGTALDRVAENNERRFLIDARVRTRRVLYFVGAPNTENKFIRRALEGDEVFSVNTLVRISKAEQKFVFRGKKSSLSNPLFEGFESDGAQAPRYDESVFLRIGPDAADIKGYPDSAESIFGFDLIVWGEVESDFFSHEQLNQTREFVRTRGGTLLLIGGGKSLTRGNYAASVLGPMLPVLLGGAEAASDADRAALELFSVEPTAEGIFSGAFSLNPDIDENRIAWEAMPPLGGLEQFSFTKAGATVLARAKGAGGGEGSPLFAYQRFGEGRCAILATGSTWLWQMLLDRRDESHERLWRQIFRELVRDVPDPIVLVNPAERYYEGLPIELDLLVRDEIFVEREGANVQVTVNSSQSIPIAVDVEESLQSAGLYSCTIEHAAPGVYEISVAVIGSKEELIGSFDTAILVEPDLAEFSRPRGDSAYLREIAEASGGAYFDIERFSEILERIPRREPDVEAAVTFRLWHVPALFFVLVGLLSAEWFLRRREGIP